MNSKSFLTALAGIAIVSTIGYLTYVSMQPVTVGDKMMPTPEDSMMSSSAMMKSEDAMMQKDEGMMKSEDAMMQKQSAVAYTDYHEGVIGNGQTSVLFFHAKWCPACRQADTDLKEIYDAAGAALPTYKVDYDNSADLKSTYGVTYQHTFVVIDGTGKAIKTVLGPSKAQLAALVK